MRAHSVHPSIITLRPLTAGKARLVLTFRVCEMKNAWWLRLGALLILSFGLMANAVAVERRQGLTNGDITAISVQGDRIYVGGRFTEVDGVAAIGIAVWNGSRWSALGGGITQVESDRIDAIIEVDGRVYAGGIFSRADDQPVHNVAVFDGSRWSPVGLGSLPVSTLDRVTSLAAFQGDIYAAVRLGGVGIQTTDVLVRWDGQRWSRTGSGLVGPPPNAPARIAGLGVFRSELYMAGSFISVDDVPINHVARWNGTRWASIGVIREQALRMAVSDSHVVIASGIGSIFGTDAVYTWDGQALVTLPGPPPNGATFDLATWGADVYVESLRTLPSIPRYFNWRWTGSTWAEFHPESDRGVLMMDRGVISVGGNDLRRTGTPQILSIAANDLPANGASSQARLSADGRRAVFVSEATNLGGSAAGSAVYVLDRTTGTRMRISDLALALNPGLQQIFSGAAISADASTVAFDGSSGQIYVVRDNRAVLASASQTGSAGTGASSHGALSVDGGLLAFDSQANNLLASDANGSISDVYLKNLGSGAVELVSVAADGTAANGPSLAPAVNADATRIAFVTTATNLTGTANGPAPVAQIVLSQGSGASRRSLLVSRNRVTGEAGNGASRDVRLTPRGRYGVFVSSASNLVDGDTNGVDDVFLFEFDGVSIIRLERISTAHYGMQANAASGHPSITDNGDYVAFESAANNLVVLDRNATKDIFLKRIADGQVRRVSASANGVQPDGASYLAEISGNGDGIVFASEAANLATGDNNGKADVFFATTEVSTTIDEPGFTGPLPPTGDAFPVCPGGFFYVTVDDDDSVRSNGLFAVSVVLSPGTGQRFEGGLNFGGLVDASQEGFAGFNIENPANEAQRLNLNLTGHVAQNRDAPLPVRIQVIRQPSAGVNQVIYERTTTLSMAQPFIDSLVIQPGFHVVSVLPTQGRVDNVADGQVFVQATTQFVDRIGGGFFGGVVSGGYHARHPYQDASGYAAFCLGSAHSAYISTDAAPIYGSRGARDLRLRVYDYQRREIVRVPAAP